MSWPAVEGGSGVHLDPEGEHPLLDFSLGRTSTFFTPFVALVSIENDGEFLGA